MRVVTVRAHRAWALQSENRKCKVGIHSLGPRHDRMLANSLAAIHAIRPDLGLRSRAILEAILFVEGPVGSMESLARLLGLRNRFALARLLRRDKLPPLRRLAAWASILSWVQSAERDGASLCRLALRSRRYPSACYRLVKEITGLRWEVVRRRGSQWIEKQLLREFVGKKRRTVPACHS